MSFRASFTGTCDVIVERAAFEDFTYSSSGGAIYYDRPPGSIMICFSSFKGCQTTEQGGAIYSIAGALQLINSCLSYCIASNSGQFMLYARLAPSDDAECDVCCNLTLFLQQVHTFTRHQIPLGTGFNWIFFIQMTGHSDFITAI
jgi:hypothetical protein